MDMTARKNGRRVNYMLEFATVRYWQGQLNESGIKKLHKHPNRHQAGLPYPFGRVQRMAS